MIDTEPLIPPGAGVAIALIDHALKEFPADRINPGDCQTERCQRFGELPGSVADYDHSHAAVFRYAVQAGAKFDNVERPVLFVVSNTIIL